MDDIAPHLPGLRRYARALTGNAWAADDLVQDTLERACRKWLLWRPGSDLRAWLFTLMHRVYLNQLRAVPAQPPLDLESVQDHLQAPATRTDDALDLDRCLQRLPAEQRAVLLLVTLEDMDYTAAAKVLDVPVGTVMSRLSRARQRLRELMEPQARTPGAAPEAVAQRTPSPPAAPRLRRLK
ncbi:RNA polymerase subunit sigma-24 [Paracidovorax avenae]|uniref:RNA polymerase sigma factor n=1 Tax=Paracidovorax avenae TaxID=80867 RepID=UPI000D176ECB|nr:RNA polymerase sigma factor [Paracidovorax avenae]AVS70328.1 RNA polymerase subunit sigma-24 [Paracidovorax avenae]